MGPTGVGKSTFIQIATGLDIGIGHELTSYTKEVSTVRVKSPFDGTDVVLVDTPGFDDTYRSDMDILSVVAKWLMNTYRGGVRISGIIYLHRISDNRMAGTPLKNLAMFENLCGNDFFKRVILATTMWGDDDELVRREEKLIEDHWEQMIRRGSAVLRFEHTASSAWNILGHLIGTERNRRWDSQGGVLRIQEELLGEGTNLVFTAAGRVLRGARPGGTVDILMRLEDERRMMADPDLTDALLSELDRVRKKQRKEQRKYVAYMRDVTRWGSSFLGKMRRVLAFMRDCGV